MKPSARHAASEASQKKWKEEVDSLIEYLSGRGLTIVEANMLFKSTTIRLRQSFIPPRVEAGPGRLDR